MSGVGQQRAQRTDEITVLEVEAIELVAGLLRIHYVFIYNERGAFGVASNALADLAGESQHTIWIKFLGEKREVS